MKALKKTLCLLLALVLLLCSAPVAFAEPGVFVVGGECGPYLTWEYVSTGTLTISGEGAMYGYSGTSGFDENGNYYSLTNAPWGQYADSIKTVVIGDSVTSIGNHAFSSCTVLKSVTIGNSVMSIGYDAFSRCTALESVTFGDGMQSIGEGAFYNCAALESVTFPDSLQSIGSSAFSGCSALESVTFGDSLQSIGKGAFYNCRTLESVTFGDGLQSIGYDVFYGCPALESVILPDGVTSIGNGAFGNSDHSEWTTLALCNKGTTTAATLAATEFPYAFLDGTDEDNLIRETVNAKLSYTIDRRTRTLTIQNDGAMVSFASFTAPWVEYQKYITDVVILPGCTSVSSSAFQYCYNLKRVTLPDGVESIGSFAFNNCYNLTQIELPDGVESIGSYAFSSCSRLPSISLPDSVTYIGDDAFYNCRALESATFGDGLQSIGYEAFCNCRTLESIVIPDSVTRLGYDKEGSIFTGCSSLKSAVIGDGVTDIPYAAFSGCSSLETVAIGDSVREIGSSAFSGCTSLHTVILPESVSVIVSRAFPEKALTDLWIYNRNCSINDGSIYYSATLHGYTGSTAETFADTYGYSFEPITDAPPHDHDKTLVEGYAPTCTDAGLTDGYRCSVCGKWITKQKPIKALGHDLQPTETVMPTDTAPGFVRYECTRCDAGYTEVLPVNTHTHSFTVTDSRDATCLEGGYATYYCPGCGYSYTDIFDALDHSFGAWKTFLPVEAGQAGIDVRFCSRCGVYELRESEAVGTGTAPVDPNHEHNFVQVEAKEPDCENAGYVRYLCSCGAGKVEIKNALGHDFKVTVYEPTCLDEGYTSYACTRCRYGYSDSIVPALGHTDANGDGECDRCGTPTGTGDPCANGHDLGDWVIRSEPTCTQKGYKSRYCKRCNKPIETEEIAALGHNFKVDQSKSRAATCTEAGFQKEVCTRCGFEKDTTLKVLGHIDENDDGKCDRCKEKLTDADEEEEDLNFFQRIIQWFENLFAKLFGKK